ncbi:MAG: class I adenylate-forming enzyme family protein, partial [Mycobacteriales bacterium]
GRTPRHGRIVQLTSGTTGQPREAVRTPRAADVADLGLGLIDRLGPTRASTALVCTPLFHGMGLVGLGLGLFLGGHVVLRPRFDPAAVLADAGRHGADTLVVVPEMLALLLTAGTRPATVRRVVTGGAPLRPELAEAVRRRWGDVLYNAYGTTECGIATVATPADLRRAPGTVGRPLRGVTVGVSDDELTIAGRLSVAGARRTGDLGVIRPDGLVMLTGRADDLIISGGENVHPAEVEEAIRSLPDVDDVAVAGAPDQRLGQQVVAWVVRRAGSTISADEIIGAVRAQLEAVKAPHEVRFVTALPRTELGKIRRRDLLGGL